MAQQYTFDINAAMQAGYTPDQIQQYLSAQQKQGNQYQLSSQPQATPQQSQQPAQPKSNWLADTLPTVGSVVGGIGGALIPVLGETGIGEIGGAAAGGAAGEGLKELIEGKPLSAKDIATQGVVGGVGGAVGKGVGYVGGKVLSKVGNAITNGVGDAAAQSINKATPAAWLKATEQHGVDLNQLTQDYVAPGSSYDDLLGPIAKRGMGGTIQDQLKTAEDQIQSTVKTAGSNIRIAPTTLVPELQQEAKTLSMLPGNENKIDSMNNIITQFQKQYPNGLSVQRALAIKRAADSKFGQAVVQDETGSAATMAQKMIANAARTTLKGMFPELSDALDTQSNLYTLQPILAKARAAEATGKTGILNALQNVNLTKPGTMIAPIVDALGLNKPQVTSRFLNPTLPGVNPLVGKAVAQTAGQGVVHGVAGTLPAAPVQANANNPQQANQTTINGIPEQNSQNNTSNNFNQSNTLPSSPQAAFGGNTSTNNSTIQATPTTPNANPLQGYTVNGQPLDPAMANLIYKVATYQLDPTKMTSLKNNERERLVSLASQFDPSYDSSQFPVKQKVREDFASGKSAQNVKAINTAIGHLYELSQTGNELGNGSVPLLNEVKNAFQTGTGNAKANNFETDADAVAGEMSNIFKATGGTDAEIAAWRQHFKSDMSPAQQAGVIRKAVDLMAGRLQALQAQYTQGLGKPTGYQFLNPNSQAILKGFGIDPSSLTQQSQ